MLDINFSLTLMFILCLAIEPFYVYYVPSVLVHKKGILIFIKVQKDFKLFLHTPSIPWCTTWPLIYIKLYWWDTVAFVLQNYFICCVIILLLWTYCKYKQSYKLLTSENQGHTTSRIGGSIILDLQYCNYTVIGLKNIRSTTYSLQWYPTRVV